MSLVERRPATCLEHRVTTLRPATLDKSTSEAARAFLRNLNGRCSPAYALVFGSRARGTHTSESDADLAVVLEGAPGDRWTIACDMAAIAFDVMLETGVLVDPLPLWEAELSNPELFGNPVLIENIKRDGLRL